MALVGEKSRCRERIGQPPAVEHVVFELLEKLAEKRVPERRPRKPQTLDQGHSAFDHDAQQAECGPVVSERVHAAEQHGVEHHAVPPPPSSCAGAEDFQSAGRRGCQGEPEPPPRAELGRDPQQELGNARQRHVELGENTGKLRQDEEDQPQDHQPGNHGQYDGIGQEGPARAAEPHFGPQHGGQSAEHVRQSSGRFTGCNARYIGGVEDPGMFPQGG